MAPHIDTPRLSLERFAMSDADELFQCITPAVTKFMTWDPPSFDDYKSRCEALSRVDERTEAQFVIRRKDTRECLGIAGVERLGDALPELGIWMKETAHRQGYGREAVEAVARWAFRTCNGNGLIYPVAIENIASRRIAEGLKGEVIATRSGPKYDSVVYKISSPAPRSLVPAALYPWELSEADLAALEASETPAVAALHDHEYRAPE